MKMALVDARKGIGRTSPNPAVGAVVVKNGVVVGKGYHRCAGAPHAEPNALRDAGKESRGATIYVTLEPCNHQGRTPPCTQAILKSGIARVVVGMEDPNPQVAGGGNSFLRRQGIEVSSGILEERCRELNRPFIKHAVSGLPWVIMKAGMSVDGRIAAGKGVRTRITSEDSKRHLHRLRNRVDAILVGAETVLIDDPSLTTRLPAGNGHDPLRLILDSRLRLSPRACCLNQQSQSRVVVFCHKRASADRAARLADAGAEIVRVGMKDKGLDLHGVLTELGRRNIQSLLVEGGARVHGSFLRDGLVDQLLLYVAPLLLGDKGVPLVDFGAGQGGVARQLRFVSSRSLGVDRLVEGRFEPVGGQ